MCFFFCYLEQESFIKNNVNRTIQLVLFVAHDNLAIEQIEILCSFKKKNQKKPKKKTILIDKAVTLNGDILDSPNSQQIYLELNTINSIDDQESRVSCESRFPSSETQRPSYVMGESKMSNKMHFA